MICINCAKETQNEDYFCDECKQIKKIPSNEKKRVVCEVCNCYKNDKGICPCTDLSVH